LANHNPHHSILQAPHTRDDTGQHFCSPAHPELTRNCPAQPVYAKLQLIFWPGPAHGL